MIEGLVYFSPLLILLIASLILMFGEHEEDEQYKCFRFSRIMLLCSYVMAVIFYNKPFIMGLGQGNKFSLLFESLLYGCCLMLLYLSRKWFAAMQRTAYTFCGCLLLMLLNGCLLISSINIGLSVFCAVMIMICHYMMLKYSSGQKDITLSLRIYLFSALICSAFLSVSAIVFYLECGSLDYETVRLFLEVNQTNPYVFVIASLFVVPFIFLLAVAPLHFWLTETLGQVVLPVFVYFILMSFSAIWGGFIHINIAVLAPLAAYFRTFYTATALLSVGIGAIGACCGQNIRKIFSYMAVYHSGIILLTLRKFTPNALNSGFIYMFAYLLAMFGICCCLFGFKKKGDYPYMLSEFEGASQKRPYISAMMLIFMFSLLGFPPFFGFLGLFSSLNYLALHHHFYQLIYLSAMMLVIGYGCLQIIRALYFVERKTVFDRADSGIYTAIFLNAAIMILLILQPQYLTDDIRIMLETVFP